MQKNATSTSSIIKSIKPKLPMKPKAAAKPSIAAEVDIILPIPTMPASEPLRT